MVANSALRSLLPIVFLMTPYLPSESQRVEDPNPAAVAALSIYTAAQSYLVLTLDTTCSLIVYKLGALKVSWEDALKRILSDTVQPRAYLETPSPSKSL